MMGTQAEANVDRVSPADPVRRFLLAISRTEQVVDGETQLLRSGGEVELAELSKRKSRCLLELSRAMRALPKGRPDTVVEQRLKALSVSLEANAKLLAARLAAAQEVSEIITKAMKEARSDGTYGPPKLAAVS